MKKRFFYIAFVILFGSASMIVSAQEARDLEGSQTADQPAEILTDAAHNADDAISHAQTLPSREEKVEYLTEEAQRFLGMNQYEEAERISAFILSTYDPNNAEAQSVLERAQTQSRDNEDPASLQNPSPEDKEQLKREMWDERTQNPANAG